MILGRSFLSTRSTYLANKLATPLGMVFDFWFCFVFTWEKCFFSGFLLMYIVLGSFQNLKVFLFFLKFSRDHTLSSQAEQTYPHFPWVNSAGPHLLLMEPADPVNVFAKLKISLPVKFRFHLGLLVSTRICILLIKNLLWVSSDGSFVLDNFLEVLHAWSGFHLVSVVTQRSEAWETLDYPSFFSSSWWVWLGCEIYPLWKIDSVFSLQIFEQTLL